MHVEQVRKETMVRFRTKTLLMKENM